MKAKDAVFVVDRVEEDRPSRLRVVPRGQYAAMPNGGHDYTMGAAFFRWKEIPDSQIMACVMCTGFEIVENYGVPVKDVTKELEKIDGFTEYWNAIGVMTGMLH